MFLRIPLLHKLSTFTTPVVLLNALPGCGKSTLLKQLAEQRSSTVSHHLPDPVDHPIGEVLFWDPAGSGLSQHLQQVMAIAPQLEQRQQTLFMSGAWIGNNAWISDGLLYQKLTLIEQSELMMSEHEIATFYPQSDAETIWRQTAGWPVLVANWDRIQDERFTLSWTDYLHNRVLPLLPFHTQRLLVALAYENVITQEAITNELELISAIEPLIELNAHGEYRLGVPFLRPILQSIAQQEPRLYQDAMRIVSRHHHKMGQRMRAINIALDSSNVDLALRWFKQNGGGVYGYHHGFDELENILSHFPTIMLSQDLHLAWANVILLFKRQRFLAARSFIENLPQQHKNSFESAEERGIFTLIKSKYFAYFRSQTEDSQLKQFSRLESLLSDNSGALMNYYGTLSIYHNNLGEWFQAAILQDKELTLATRYEVPYLIFYCHFNLTRLNLRMGYPVKSLHHIQQADIALKRTSFRSHLTYELNFVTLAQGMIAMYQGDVVTAQTYWNRVAVLRANSEIWPEFLSQIHTYGIMTFLLRDDIDRAYTLLDELRYEYFTSFADEQAAVFYNLLTVLILQQQERWIDAQEHLQDITNTNDTVPGNYQAMFQWLTVRNNVGLVCIHQHKSGQEIRIKQSHPYPYHEIQHQVQQLKLQWHKREYAQMTRSLIHLMQRCHQLQLWSPMMLEQHWLNSAIQWVWKKEKYRYTNTPFEHAVKHWQQLEQQISQHQQSDELTNKQLQIVQRLAEGLSNKQIAQYCGISESTVKFHLKNLFKTYEVKNRQALLGLARIKKWIK